MTGSTMQAVRFDHYGEIDVLNVVEVPRPHPGPGRVVVDVAAAARVRLLQIRDRELHGKFLLWDDDHVVVTSLNWSSADTRSDAPQAEIGLYIQSPGVAEDVRRRLLQDWPALGPPSDVSQEAPARTKRPRGARRRRRP